MPSPKNAPVAVVIGSDSDMEVMKSCIEQLGQFGIQPTVRIISAHRTPEVAAEFAQSAEKQGTKVIIAAAGMAAHLAGALAARTALPVIGVPLVCSNSGLGGLDALLSTVQMPPGIPVATMTLGPAGAKNAAVFAAEILALSDPAIRARLVAFRQAQADNIRAKDAALK